MKKKPVCSMCGSSEIVFTEITQWNIDKQDYESKRLANIAHCESCGLRTGVEWVSAEPDLVLKAVAYEDIPVGRYYLALNALGQYFLGEMNTNSGFCESVKSRWLLPEDKE